MKMKIDLTARAIVLGQNLMSSIPASLPPATIG